MRGWGYTLIRLSRALNLLVAIKQVAGPLDSVKRVISVTSYVNGTPDLTDSSHVINGTSDLLGKGLRRVRTPRAFHRYSCCSAFFEFGRGDMPPW